MCLHDESGRIGLMKIIPWSDQLVDLSSSLVRYVITSLIIYTKLLSYSY